MEQPTKQQLEQVQDERYEQYGSALEGHANLGLVWTSILQQHYGIRLAHPIPAHLAMVMMAAMKCNRAALPGYRTDDYIDGISYLDLALGALREQGLLE